MRMAVALMAGVAGLGFNPAAGEDLNPAPLAAAVAGAQAHGFGCDSVGGLAELLVQVQGRATIIDLDGQRREYAFGPEGKIRLKDGGSELDLRFVPDQAEIEGFIRELADLYTMHGPDPALIEKAVAALGDLDRFGELRVAGVVVELDGSRHAFAGGNAANESPKKLAAKMRNGGVMLQLRMAPGETAMALLRAATGSPGPPQASAADDQKAAAPQLLDQALANPEARSLLNQGLQDPAVQGLLKRGMDDPETMKLAQEALNSDAAQALLGQMLGGLAKPAEGQANETGQTPGEDPRDAEIRELKNELREQRLMLEKILEKIGPR